MVASELPSARRREMLSRHEACMRGVPGSQGTDSVAKVTTTAATTIVILTVVATIATVVVLVLVVLAVGRSGWCKRLRLRSWRCSAGVEHCRSSRWPSGVQVDLFQKVVIINFKKVQERRGAPDDGHEVLEVLVEAMMDVEDEDLVINGRP
jgi:hypothetical protein